MTVMVDSDIPIEVSLGRNLVLYSPVSVAELWAGARPSEYDTLSSLFAALTCAPIDAETGRMAGACLRQ